jgi:LysM repeat protein
MIVDQLFTTYTVVGKNKQFFTEGRHRSLLKEDVTYRKFHNLSRMLAERKMSEKEILDLFAAIEAGANASGKNRTALGRGKDAVTVAYNSAKDAIGGVLNSIAKSTPVAGVDAAYNDATGALRDAVGANSKVMDSIKKYRLLAKEYPKTQLFVKTALIALAGVATGGAGLPVIAGVTAAIDAAIRGEKLSSIIGKGAGAGLMGLGAQEVAAALSAPSGPMGDPDFYNDTPLPAGDPDFYNDTPLPAGDPDFYNDPSNPPPVPSASGGTYTVMKGDQGGFIAQAQGVPFKDLKALNPDITNWNKLPVGTELQLPPSGTNTGSVWQGTDMSAPGVAPAGPGVAPDVTPASTPAPMGDPSFYKIDYSQPGPVTTDSMGQKLEYGIPVNANGGFMAPNPGLQPEELAGQQAAYDNWLADYKSRYPNAVQQPDGSWNLPKPSPSNINPNATAADLANSPFRPKNESINYKIIPAEQLIDQKLTVMAWALNESTGRAPARNIHLTHKGVYTVIENVDRYRRVMLKELDAMGPNRTNIPAVPRQDMPAAPQAGAVKPGMIGRGLNWLDKTAGKVGGYLSKQAQNFTRKVTAAKLKTEWEQEGHQTDSDYIAAFLAQQGVPQEVITDVYGKMGIPYTAPATVPNGTQPQQQGAGGAADLQTGDIYNIDPSTGKPYGRNKLAADLAAKQAGAAQTSNTPAPTPGVATGRITKPANMTSITSNPAAFNAANVMQMKGMEKYAKPAAAAKPANFGAAPAGYGKVTQTFKPPGAPSVPTAPKAPADQELTSVAETIKQVKKMLENVETRDDVTFIKKYINKEFRRHGLVSESAKTHRSHLLNEVTRIGALRRRSHSQQLAT